MDEASQLPSPAARSSRPLTQRFRLWARRVDLGRKLAYALTAAAGVAGAVTYAALTEGLDGDLDPSTVLALLNVDLVILLALATVVIRRIVALWSDRRRGGGRRLHTRMVLLFSLVAVTPSIMMAVGSGLFFHFGVESWFNERVRTALHDSLAVARSYLAEHQQVIAGDAQAMANDLNREGPFLLRNSQRLNQLVGTHAALRGLPEAVIFEGATGRVLARSPLAFTMEMSIGEIPQEAIEKARAGNVALMTTDDDDRVRALVRLEAFGDAFLYVGRFVDPKVIAHMAQTSAAVAEYNRLEGRRSHIEISFAMVFILVALLLLLAAVWVGLSLATRLAKPIVAMMDAAERVGGGDLAARVEEAHGNDELASLSRAFNRMTEQLQTQQRELIDTNRLLDERRRFTETVLAGVSAGVIGLDANGSINLTNRSASDLLGIHLEDKAGLPLGLVVTEMAEHFEALQRRPEKLLQAEIAIARDGGTRVLLVRMAPERLGGEVIGYVVTFDDITELMSAQRKAAWADVARRIAHEIKNPLTPIQLSAERLKRKYLKEIQSDPETFVNCTDTIVRQVGDIGRMVDEFSSFARMPAPQMKEEDLMEVVRQAVFLQRHGYPDVGFETDLPDEPVRMTCDARQIGQALTNILKNAVESIQGRDGADLPPGRVVVSLGRTARGLAVQVRDNGRGLPADQRDRLTEPYVTTRAKGTGLGLAIVKKIMEDHGGDLRLEDAPGGGASVSLIFPAAAGAAVAHAAAEASHGS